MATQYARPRTAPSAVVRYTGLASLAEVANFLKARRVTFEVDGDNVNVKVPRKTITLKPDSWLVEADTGLTAVTGAAFDKDWEMTDAPTKGIAAKKTDADDGGVTEVTPDVATEKALAQRAEQRAAAVEVAPENKPDA